MCDSKGQTISSEATAVLGNPEQNCRPAWYFFEGGISLGCIRKLASLKNQINREIEIKTENKMADFPALIFYGFVAHMLGAKTLFKSKSKYDKTIYPKTGGGGKTNKIVCQKGNSGKNKNKGERNKS